MMQYYFYEDFPTIITMNKTQNISIFEIIISCCIIFKNEKIIVVFYLKCVSTYIYIDISYFFRISIFLNILILKKLIYVTSCYCFLKICSNFFPKCL